MNRLYLIARREFLSYVATVGFWISLMTVPLFMTMGFLAPQLLEGASPSRLYSVIARDGATAIAIAERLRDAEYVRVEAPSASPDELRPYLLGERQVDGPNGPGALHAVLFIRGTAEGGYELDYWSANLASGTLKDAAEDALADRMADAYLRGQGVDPNVVAAAEDREPVVRELSPDKEEGAEEVTMADRLPYILGAGAGFVLWSVLFSVVNMLLTSTIEEKGNKILEVLMSSARLTEILAGKLLGVAGVSFTLIVVWIAAALGVMTMIAAFVDTDNALTPVFSAVLDPALLIPFVGYFVIGYLMYGAVFMAIGSLCETIQEAQTFMSPLIIVLMIPLGLLVFSIQNLDSPLIAAASWVPFFTPFLMIARLPTGLPLWEIAATTAVMVGFTFLVLLTASFIFRQGALGQVSAGNLKRLLPGSKS